MEVQEEWRDIEGYDGEYRISNYGRVKSLKNGNSIIMKPRKDRKGYLYLSLSKSSAKKTFKIHRLVAIHFISNPHSFPEVNHKDEIKTNNKVNNLEWCTPKYNVNYGTSVKRRARTQMKKLYQYSSDLILIKVWNGLCEVKEEGFNIASISMCCNKKYKTSYGFIWSYTKL